MGSISAVIMACSSLFSHFMECILTFPFAAIFSSQDYLGTCTTSVTESSLRSGGADGGGRVPRFVTIVSDPSQEVAYDLAWVHVTVVPLISHDAAAVQKQYQWGREDPGPFLTPEQYEAGRGSQEQLVGIARACLQSVLAAFISACYLEVVLVLA